MTSRVSSWLFQLFRSNRIFLNCLNTSNITFTLSNILCLGKPGRIPHLEGLVLEQSEEGNDKDGKEGAEGSRDDFKKPLLQCFIEPLENGHQDDQTTDGGTQNEEAEAVGKLLQKLQGCASASVVVGGESSAALHMVACAADGMEEVLSGTGWAPGGEVNGQPPRRMKRGDDRIFSASSFGASIVHSREHLLCVVY